MTDPHETAGVVVTGAGRGIGAAIAARFAAAGHRVAGLDLDGDLVTATAKRWAPDGGALVMMSSLNGLMGFPGRTAYGAAKAGIAGLVRGLAVEWAPRGLRVNAIAPGSITTELSADFLRRGVIDEQQFLDRIPMNRFGRVEEVAELAFFLGTPLSSYVTGVVVPIDGGWSAQGITA